MKVYSILIALLLISLSNTKVVTNPSSERHFCPKERPAEGVMCAQIYNPVCGVPFPDKIMCIRAPCVLQHSNACEACNNLNIEYYIQGNCEDIDFNVEYCQEEERLAEFCTMEYTPTCGYQSDGSIEREFSNRCTACKNNVVSYIKRGNCPVQNLSTSFEKDRCNPSERNVQICNTLYIQTCGFQADGQIVNSFGNRCNACSNPDVEYVIFGPCPQLKEERANENKCLDSERNRQMCTLEYIATCGYSKDGQQWQNFGNRCSACTNPEIEYIEYAPCPEEKTSESLDLFCLSSERETLGCPRNLDWVCGLRFDQEKPSSYANRCIACQDPLVQRIQLGECKEIAAASLACSTEELETQLCPQIYRPVCATLKNNRIPRKTFENRCRACASGEVDEIQEGQCFSKLSVEKPKLKICNHDIVVRCSSQLFPVCAQFFDCDSSDQKCWKTYTNQCIGCSDKNIEGILSGSCSEINFEQHLGVIKQIDRIEISTNRVETTAAQIISIYCLMAILMLVIVF